MDAVTAYYARRAANRSIAADLTADTFVAAITSFGSFGPRQGHGQSLGVRHCPAGLHPVCETYSSTSTGSNGWPSSTSSTRTRSGNC